MVVQMAISRSREYAADNLGARISGRLASALVKISRVAEAVPNDTAETHPTTAPLFIVNPLSGRVMDNLFSTPIDRESDRRARKIIARNGPRRFRHSSTRRGFEITRSLGMNDP